MTRIENVGILFFKEEININTGLLKLIRGENKMIQCVSYDEVSNEIIQMMRRKTIIPVIGSGFTRDCIARSGKVPSGEDYYNYMIAQIVDQNPDEMKVKELNNESFSSISSIYHKMVQAEKQQSYLLNKFTNVKLENVKKNFLKIDWPYIYTLNIDDAIENNSEFKTVLYANRDIRNSIFEQEKCVIKLHGDIKDILKYEDSNCEIFDQKQYVVSIKKNVSLLKKLTHDYEYLNLLYIGCSLSDEIDLLFSTSMANDNNNNRYYCSTQIPTLLQKTKLEAFGITHCIVFESYDDIYEKMTDAFHQSLCITPDELEQFSTYEFKTLGTGFELNCPYLFQGKSILNNSKIAIYPSFFVSRTLGKVYASDAINLDLVEEFEMQCKKAMPLIEKESTWVFEMSAANNSPLKYVVNAEYWLFNQLDILAKSRKGREKIIEANYYYRMKQVRKACLEAIPKEPAEQSVVPVPAELMTMEIPADATQIQSRQSVSASLEIKVNDITLCVTELTSSELLTKVLQVIRDVK